MLWMEIWQGMGRSNFEGKESDTVYSISLQHSKSSKQPVPKLCSEQPQYLHYRLDSLGLDSWQDQEIFLFSKMSWLILRLTQPPIQQVSIFSSQGG